MKPHLGDIDWLEELIPPSPGSPLSILGATSLPQYTSLPIKPTSTMSLKGHAGIAAFLTNDLAIFRCEAKVRVNTEATVKVVPTKT